MTKSSFLLLAWIVISMLFSFDSIAQTLTDGNALKKIAELESANYQLRKVEAANFANINGLPMVIETPDGRFAEIQYIDENGRPQYYVTDNANAAKTISTNQVYSGGNAGLNLTGSGITAREWDGGAVRLDHQEFGGRVVQGDGATTLNYHSTHVAGTIMAAGVIITAQGMAPAAQLRAFEWNNDVSEMATEGANGALMSNHSYGYVRGWYNNGSTWVWYGNTSISTQEDYLFGFYDSQAQSWDNIARNAPYFLICKSAGNDRNEGPVGGPYPPDGPYDCIGHAGNAKNILTVGAVNDITSGYTGPSSVIMSSFSCWGPADDGRIKPDIVANGISLYSTDKDSNSDYVSLSGTSMATPSVTGSLALLQQHWNSLNPGTYMLAATLKALVLHTADEAGTADGPDYQFGWGLMNTRSAALKISEDATANVIEELVLNNGGTYTRTVESDGTQPLKVTICWTDVPGTPVSAQLDPVTPMLVNDLDLHLAYSMSTYFPWKLDCNSPAGPATNNTENNVDNVEMVFIATPSAGTYTITVDHDGTLSGGSQAFSIVISGAAAEDSPYIILPYLESFEAGFGEWTQATNDDFDWTRRIGTTPTTKTGPKKAYNGTYYIYTEASSPQAPGDEASLEAVFTFAGIPNPELSLWYHMYGSQMGTLHIDVFNGTWTNDVWSLSGQQQTTDRQVYRNAIINLSAFGNQTGVTIRIRGTIGSGERSDLSIDYVQVRQQGSTAPAGPLPDITEMDTKTDLDEPGIENAECTPNIYAFNKIIFIRNNCVENLEGRVSLYNTMGQIFEDIEINGSNAYELSSPLKPGIYIIRITSDNQTISRKILIN